MPTMFSSCHDKVSRKVQVLAACSLVLIMPLSGCDLARNQLKTDRNNNMEFQDYRDAMSPRMPDAGDDVSPQAGIPDLKPYVAQPSENLKAMPLVSLSVNQTVPVRDVLFELAEQADYDIELDPRIRGSIIFTARNRPFDVVVERISEIAGLRYKFEDDMLRVELDTPYHEIYKINYLAFSRTSESSISNDVAVVSGDGTDTGSRFAAESVSEADFWGELETNLTQILNVNRDASTLRTSRDPRITAVEEAPAPVQPLVLDENGEISEGGPQVDVQAPNAVLRVESLPVDELEDQNMGGSGDSDPFAPRYSVNRQAGIISVFAQERLQKRVDSYLKELKKSVTSQVLIEAKVLEVALTDEFSAGIDWNQVFGIFGGDAGVGFNVTGGLVRGLFEPPESQTSNFNANWAGKDFSATIDALSRFGTVQALASPRLTVMNNQSAVLNVAKNQVYFEVDVDVTTDGGGATQTTFDSEIRNVPEGLLINVQPAIDLEQQLISMAVRPTVTRIIDFINDPAVEAQTAGLANPIESEVPVVNIQEFDSIIQMNSGQAIVMGGLMQDRTNSTQNAVPVLGELPIVGAAFRNQQDEIEKTELVVLLRATIVEGGNNIHDTDRDLYRTFSGDRRPFQL